VIIGRYPDMTLLQARAAAEETQQKARRGITTQGVRSRRRAVAAVEEAQQQHDALAERATFGATAKRWIEARRSEWSDSTFRKARLSLDGYLIPAMGGDDVRTLESRRVRPVLMEMHARVPELAKKARQYAKQVIEHAINEGLRDDDSALRLERIFPQTRSGHMPAVTENEGMLGRVMLAIDSYRGRIVRAGLILLATTAVRPGMVAEARWDEINLKKGEWNIPAERMKTRQPFTTSLPEQALAALRDMHSLSGGQEYAFLSLTGASGHMHRDALSKALRDMGFQGKQSAHGFRATFRTFARERLGVDVDVLEAQLAHAPRGEVQAAYARTTFRQQRREVIQRWADYLDKLRDNGGNVVPIK
jgi:integrase